MDLISNNENEINDDVKIHSMSKNHHEDFFEFTNTPYDPSRKLATNLTTSNTVNSLIIETKLNYDFCPQKFIFEPGFLNLVEKMDF